MNNFGRNVYASPEAGGKYHSCHNTPRSRHYSGSVHRPTSILTGLRELMGRQRSESVDNEKRPNVINKPLRRVQVETCQVESVYDLREEDESKDLYTDSLAFRRPRSNSSDLLILRKTSRPLSVDVVGLVDEKSDPYRQYMKVIDCYELAPHSGEVVIVDKFVKLEKAFRAMSDNGVGAALVWSAKEDKVVSILTLTDFILSLLSGSSNESTTVAESISKNSLVTLDVSCKLLDACQEFYSNRVHRIAITEPSGDVLYLLTIKRILQAVHKQNRSLHFAMWLGCEIKNARIGTWDNIHSVGENEMLENAVRKMIDYRISSIPIVDTEGRPTDVLCKADIAASLAASTDIKDCFHRYTVLETVSHRPRASFLTDVDTVASVLDLALNRKDHRCVFIKDSDTEKLIAAVSLSDFITFILTHKQPLNNNAF